MKVYIATPVNARKEKTIEAKRKAAYKRVQYLTEEVQKQFEDAEVHSSFDLDIAPIGVRNPNWTEPEIMGRCVRRVMECDAILVDWNYQHSNGCSVEHYTALVYDKKVIYAWTLDIKPERR